MESIYFSGLLEAIPLESLEELSQSSLLGSGVRFAGGDCPHEKRVRLSISGQGVKVSAPQHGSIP